jgi:hypothetical protein
MMNYLPGDNEPTQRVRCPVHGFIRYGLLHDIGHPAFAHAGEKGIPGQDHEKISIHVIDKILGTLLDTTFFPGVLFSARSFPVNLMLTGLTTCFATLSTAESTMASSILTDWSNR